MSDLISRSELINRFLVSKDGHRIPERDCDNFEVTVSVKDVKTIIKEQPIAYDVENVVAELEELRDRYDDGIKNFAIRGIIEKAIEIIKQGGVADDVCEWEKGSSGYVGYPAYYSKCCTTNSNGLEMQTHIISDWKFCPYCGKKIKIVGD